MNSHLRIQYRDFSDVPRMFVVTLCESHYLFHSPFDEVIDDYVSDYSVYLMPPLTDDDLAGSWESLPQRAVKQIGTVPVSAIEFDPTRRKSISSAVFHGRLSHSAGKRLQ